MNTKLFSITILVATTLLGGCSVGAMNSKPIAQMSCTELAREIGRYTQLKETADADSLVGTVGMVLADNREDEITNGVESIVGDITSMSAESELEQLNRTFNQRGCY